MDTERRLHFGFQSDLNVKPSNSDEDACFKVPISMPSMLHDIVPTLLHSLTSASEAERKSASERFAQMSEEGCITPTMWMQDPRLHDFTTLTLPEYSFDRMQYNSPETYARLAITEHPGPIFIPSSSYAIGLFRVQLLPHPMLPLHALGMYHVGPLVVTLLTTATEERQKQSSKKRGRSSSNPKVAYSKPKSGKLLFRKEYDFSKMDISISDLLLPPSACRPVRLQFTCVMSDLNGRTATFTAISNPFIVISNCNQWKNGFEVCLRELLFSEHVKQVSFAKFFNYLQLAYLFTKAFPENRFLEEGEIKTWLLGCARGNRFLARDFNVLEQHNIVTETIFSAWLEIAVGVLYDLRTAHVGKTFQKLWTAGFIGIGDPSSQIAERMHEEKGSCYLSISTTPAAKPELSYVVLHSAHHSHHLLNLERDHLWYFFEHSRHTQNCTHLLSTTVDAPTLPVSTVFGLSGTLTQVLSFPAASSLPSPHEFSTSLHSSQRF